MTDIKICGLSEPDTLDAAIGAGASHVGFVFFAKSPRNLAPDEAASLASRVPPHVKRVGVFVDPDSDFLDHVRSRVTLDIIQLHSVEQPARVARVRLRHGLPVWVALGVSTSADAAAGRRYLGSANRLLFDSKAPSEAPLPGGNGLRFDWRVLRGLHIGIPWGLAGGLNARTVGEAIHASGAELVDVSSGVEDAPGVKSAAKIRAFVKAVRAA